MDEGPFRMQSAPDRRGVGRPSQPARAPEAPQQPAAAEPRAAAHQPEKQKKSNGAKWPLIIVGVLILVAAGWYAWSIPAKTATIIETDKYQAVFFANGNVYFGNLQDVSEGYYKMKGVYYPQTQTVTETEGATQQPTNDQSSITLLKLGDAIHGPEDEMMISKDQVLFYQNLRDDSKVSQLIDGQK